MEDRIRLGVSACLLGENVRFDGGHKLDRFLTDTLGQFVEYVPVCPEVECGFPVPREAMRLVGDPSAPRLVTTRTNVDHTERMAAWARTRVAELEREGLCGFVFKSNSPSSGMERVRVYDANGVPSKTGVGLFARVFMEHFPLLPVEDEGRLHDMKLRENFIERVFTLKRWRDTLATGRTRGNLVAFHTRHKLLLLAHSPKHYREMGRLVAHAKESPPDELFPRYEALLTEAMRLKTTPAKHANVLQHLMGYFKEQLSADEKRELLEAIGNYRQGHVPLIVPVTLINHYVRKYGQPYLREQWYLNPHPIELQLRNHV
ncbi:MAG TPA: DUF523 and DUF1722 domain-containing protein [Planctomycetota bacterium]|nr:DUF523 and DUF1722 domain-containing protein [Planctomycetota bacterium]HRR82201.1 DUF523 and DUF1722 domain-containing protein [Planctomycetota bacterium]HRT97328.1 DUF523 and DUF1722 domain-containing protein [Planctomycetota bacterium]